ncbi:MAG: alcohol dehydrogenase [Salinivirgaceae bacterium]|nr:MAG: alcohol dehydrogenase [Salinivirgaceae bacterium]
MHYMKSKLSLLLLALIFSGVVYSQDDISEWREENRTGISAETGLLKSWPENGPTLLWANEELSGGHSSPSFGNNSIYITGIDGADDILYALSMDGKLLWQKVMGRAWNQGYPDSRSTPTVQGKYVYTCSGLGDLSCFDGTNGDIIWQYKGSTENKGTYGKWGIAESLLIDGDKIYYTPGGPETMTIALNKKTGEIIWRSPSINDDPGYASPILVNHNGAKMLINAATTYVYGVDVENGDILWKVKYEAEAVWGKHIVCVTPIYKDGMVYSSIGYNAGGMMVKIAEDGKSAEMVWSDKVLDIHNGGAVTIDGYIYGSNWLNNKTGNWCCIDWNTGEKKWEEKWKCKGSIIAAEGLLYIYDEKDGFAGLVKPSPEKFDLISSFQVTQGKMGPYWAHPVIHNGVLYLRHTNALMAYDIKAK